jgi:hypothetical protein
VGVTAQEHTLTGAGTLRRGGHGPTVGPLPLTEPLRLPRGGITR